MKNAWPIVPLGDVLSESRESHAVSRESSYPNFGIYSFGRGTFAKPPIEGMQTSASTLYRAKSGQFVYSRLFAFEGAYAVVPADLDGSFVSNEFPLFDCDAKRLDVRFLRYWICRKPIWNEIATSGTGMGSRRQRVQPQHLLKHTLPLPPIEEQRRIVARIEALAAKIAEAKCLRIEASESLNALPKQLVDDLIGWDEYTNVPIEELLREPTLNGIGLRPSDSAPGHRILRISAGTSRSDATVDEEDAKFIEVPDREVTKYQLKAGDLLACRFNGNLHYVGRFSRFVGRSSELRLYPDKLIRFRVNLDRTTPEYVCAAMNSRRARKMIESFCATTAGNIGISATELKTVVIPVPPVEQQQKIVAHLDGVSAKVERLKSQQEQSSAELLAMLPSVLDQAFKGQL